MKRHTFLTHVGEELVGGCRLRVEYDESGTITDSWLDGVRLGDLLMIKDELGEEIADRVRIEAFESVVTYEPEEPEGRICNRYADCEDGFCYC